jgi:4-oxalocrotonate tautomerase
MPHVIVKLWPGKSEQQKQTLANQITKSVMSTLNYGEESVSVDSRRLRPRIEQNRYTAQTSLDTKKLYKKPGYCWPEATERCRAMKNILDFTGRSHL